MKCRKPVLCGESAFTLLNDARLAIFVRAVMDLIKLIYCVNGVIRRKITDNEIYKRYILGRQ